MAARAPGTITEAYNKNLNEALLSGAEECRRPATRQLLARALARRVARRVARLVRQHAVPLPRELRVRLLDAILRVVLLSYWLALLLLSLRLGRQIRLVEEPREQHKVGEVHGHGQLDVELADAARVLVGGEEVVRGDVDEAADHHLRELQERDHHGQHLGRVVAHAHQREVGVHDAATNKNHIQFIQESKLLEENVKSPLAALAS